MHGKGKNVAAAAPLAHLASSRRISPSFAQHPGLRISGEWRVLAPRAGAALLHQRSNIRRTSIRYTSPASPVSGIETPLGAPRGPPLRRRCGGEEGRAVSQLVRGAGRGRRKRRGCCPFCCQSRGHHARCARRRRRFCSGRRHGGVVWINRFRGPPS